MQLYSKENINDNSLWLVFLWFTWFFRLFLSNFMKFSHLKWLYHFEECSLDSRVWISYRLILKKFAAQKNFTKESNWAHLRFFEIKNNFLIVTEVMNEVHFHYAFCVIRLETNFLSKILSVQKI